MFDFKSYNRMFLNSSINLATEYGVRVIPIVTDKTYWKCIGVYHLTSDENKGKQNVYIEALDKNGNRVKNLYIGWTWEGRRPEQRADPILLDKPDNEPSGNIGVYWGQRVSIWVIGRNLAFPEPSEAAENLHTMHPDEGDGNRQGHHSFYVVFQETDKTVPTPLPDPNVPVNWKKNFDERQLKEIEFCRLYAKDFNHGSVGHNEKLIIAKLAELLDK